jgi:hypothetical protein
MRPGVRERSVVETEEGRNAIGKRQSGNEKLIFDEME